MLIEPKVMGGRYAAQVVGNGGTHTVVCLFAGLDRTCRATIKTWVTKVRDSPKHKPSRHLHSLHGLGRRS